MHHTRNKWRIFHRIIALLLFPQRVNFTILLTFIDFLLYSLRQCVGFFPARLVAFFPFRFSSSFVFSLVSVPCRRPTNKPRLHHIFTEAQFPMSVSLVLNKLKFSHGLFCVHSEIRIARRVWKRSSSSSQQRCFNGMKSIWAMNDSSNIQNPLFDLFLW